MTSEQYLRVNEDIERKATIVANEIERVIEAHGGAVAIEVLYKVGLPTTGRVWDEARATLVERHGPLFQQTAVELILSPTATVSKAA